MEKAYFQFKKFTIKKSNFKFIKKKEIIEIGIEFNYNGTKLSKSNKKFILKTKTTIKASGKPLINIVSEGRFTYQNISDDKLGNYLYLNAPAIVFPYIRAYISTLSTLSGITPILLPTLNLQQEKEKIEKQMKKKFSSY